MSTAERNLRRALELLEALVAMGLRQVVLAPGSRSGPLAVAAALLETAGQVRIHPAVDERSAAFFALGLARCRLRAVAVVTTSGTAVANLLPAVVEAHHGAVPLLLLTADRPRRLKHCGANQTVDQERFLVCCCRWFGAGPDAGLAAAEPGVMAALAGRGWHEAHGAPPGPVHLNLPFEEPLHDAAAVAAVRAAFAARRAAPPARRGGPAPAEPPPSDAATEAELLAGLDPDRPGVIVAGPWRGARSRHPAWRACLSALARRLDWPVLADPLSGLRGDPDLPLICAYDTFLGAADPAGGEPFAEPPQALRLGPMPAGRRLQEWLARGRAPQLLILEGDPRPQDPCRRARQTAIGLEAWCAALAPLLAHRRPGPEQRAHAARWRRAEGEAQALLERELPLQGPPREPALARWLPRLLPAEVPVMLASSSPVRDWETFSCGRSPRRWIEAFRGASGIDGTLSLAMGLAEGHGRLVLVSGDLALLHDSNGWLWSGSLGGRLLVLLLDNGGGGIFEQLPIRPALDAAAAGSFERLFAMPQAVDARGLAAAHGVPSRVVAGMEDLPEALAWGLDQRVALLLLPCRRRRDAGARHRLREMVRRTIGGSHPSGSR